MTEPEPPGVWQYQGAIGPDPNTSLASLLWEGFVHSPDRDAAFLAALESEIVARGEDWGVNRAVAYDLWNVERDLLNP